MRFVDLQNDSFFHVTFNYATLSKSPGSEVFFRPSHVDTILKQVDQNLEKKFIIHRIHRWRYIPVFISDTYQTVKVLRSSAQPVTLLSVSTTTLSFVLLLRKKLPDLILYVHSLDAIMRKSVRARRVLRVLSRWGSLWTEIETKPRITLIFQMPEMDSLVLTSILSDVNVQFRTVYLPHPLIEEPDSDQRASVIKIGHHNSKKRRFLFLGAKRVDKAYGRYEYVVSQMNEVWDSIHLTSTTETWDSAHITTTLTKGLLSEQLRTTDIIFCAYDEEHYSTVMSGTLVDALSKKTWILIGQQFFDHSMKHFKHLFRVISWPNEGQQMNLILVKAKVEFYAVYNQTILQKLEEIYINEN